MWSFCDEIRYLSKRDDLGEIVNLCMGGVGLECCGSHLPSKHYEHRGVDHPTSISLCELHHPDAQVQIPETSFILSA